MTLGEHMARGLFVAWSFLIGDKSQLKFMEMTEQGAVRSFAALSFAAPLFFLINWLQFRTPGFEWVTLIHIAALFAGYALAWVVFAGMIRFAYSVEGARAVCGLEFPDRRQVPAQIHGNDGTRRRALVCGSFIRGAAVFPHQLAAVPYPRF